MAVNPTDAVAQSASLDVRSSRTAGPTGNKPTEESSAGVEAGNSDPAVTTTISNAALATARAVQSTESTTEQNRIGQELAEERAAEDRLTQDRLKEDRQEEDRQAQNSIDLEG